MTTTETARQCGRCGKETVQYGYTRNREFTICYSCCAEIDREAMIRDGHSKTLPLYLDTNGPGYGEVSNWPGSLRFKVEYQKKGQHNMAGTRYDVWFTGPDGAHWHGTQYGNGTQIVHCKRIKN